MTDSSSFSSADGVDGVDGPDGPDEFDTPDEMKQPDEGPGDSRRDALVLELQRIVRETDTLLPETNAEDPRLTPSGSTPVSPSSSQHRFSASGTLNQRKGQFIQYIQDQIQNIKIRCNILRFKYSGYKYWFDLFNISILLLSASLTFMEAMRARFDVSIDDMTTPESVTMGVLPIMMSSVMTVASALVKFKKYNVKMENLQRAIQKTIFTIFRLKRIQENAKHLRTDEELETLIQMYSGEPFDMYVQCQEEMEKNLRYEDLVTHMKTYYDLSLSYERSEMEYRLQRLLLGATQQLREDTVDEVAADSQIHQNSRTGTCCPATTNARRSSCVDCLFGRPASPVPVSDILITPAPANAV